jgi:hypothetical protein
MKLSVVHQAAVYRMELCLMFEGILQRKARPRISGKCRGQNNELAAAGSFDKYVPVNTK